MSKTSEYKNEFNRQKYDRIGLMLPKGTKEQLQTKAKEYGISVNALITKAIEEYLNNENCTTLHKSVQ